MKRELIIQLTGNSDEDELIVERILELVKQGYTSGYSPFWEIKTIDN